MIRRAIGIQFNPWDQVYHFDTCEAELATGDSVIVRIESGVELGKVVSVSDIDEGTLDAPLKTIVRKATKEDIRKNTEQESKKSNVLDSARDLIEKHKLPMKLVDCYFSFDGGKVTLIFTADGRVDFRELVKDLSRQLQKSIRLQQIGIRDEARRLGGMGQCGRPVCCKQFLHNLSSVTTDMARIQQVHNRGSDRISGACGRLMCCLSYEADFYQEETKKYPPLESKVKTKQGVGKVISYNVIKKTVAVSIDRGIVELPLADVKKV